MEAGRSILLSDGPPIYRARSCVSSSQTFSGLCLAGPHNCVVGTELSTHQGDFTQTAATRSRGEQPVPCFVDRCRAVWGGGNSCCIILRPHLAAMHAARSLARRRPRVFWRLRNSFSNGRARAHAGFNLRVPDAVHLFVDPDLGRLHATDASENGCAYKFGSRAGGRGDSIEI